MIRSRSRSQLLWVVGNRSKFNFEGVVPVNRTSLNLEHREWESGWYLNEIIVLASALAGLFHDIGKSNALFQKSYKEKHNQKVSLIDMNGSHFVCLKLLLKENQTKIG